MTLHAWVDVDIGDCYQPERHQRHGEADAGTWWAQLRRTHTSESQPRWQGRRGGEQLGGRGGMRAELAPTARVAWVRSERPITLPTSAFTAAILASLVEVNQAIKA